MKKIIFLAAAVFLFGSAAALAANTSAGQNGIHEPGTGIASPEVKNQGTGQGQQVNTVQQTQTQQQLQNQGEDTANQIRQQTTVQQEEVLKVKNIAELKEAISQKRQELKQELSEKTEKEQKVYQNQNQVREAVHALLSAEGLAGGIGQQVSAIAREFNNSVEKTIQAEKKIQERGWLKRLLSGGDKASAEEIDKEVKMTQGKVQQLLSLKETCQCSDEVKNIIQEQIQNIEKEQTRLQEIAKSENSAKGIWGWFKGLFSKE